MLTSFCISYLFFQVNVTLWKVLSLFSFPFATSSLEKPVKVISTASGNINAWQWAVSLEHTVLGLYNLAFWAFIFFLSKKSGSISLLLCSWETE